MATTTPNFGWPVPTSTDLVKDGATAIEALGDGVDASLVDLKGGTTGQILAKATSADMDFAWITNDVGDITAVTAGTGISGGGTSGAVTITNSMATAIDAKGDLVPGTGADTFSRLAVGADFGFLQASSAAATGLAWNSGSWTGFTPTITAGAGSFTTVASQGRYQRIGKTCLFEFGVQITTNGTASSFTFFTIPFTAVGGSPAPYWVGTVADFAVTGKAGFARIGGGAGFGTFAGYDAAYLGGDSYVIGGSIVYEVA
jgi:hypothetical protein